MSALIFLSVCLSSANVTAQSARQDDKARPSIQVASAPLFLGVEIEISDPESGVLVKRVVAGSPAEGGGIRAEDRILRVGGKRVDTLQGLRQAVNSHASGDVIVVDVRREKDVLSIPVSLEKMPEPDEMARRTLLGKPFPEFDVMEPVSGRFSKTSDWKGKPTIVEIWATWCSACRFAQPAMEAIHTKHADTIRVVAMSSQSREVVLQWLGKRDAPAHELLVADEMHMDALNVNVLPTFIVIDAEGKVRDVAVGANGVLRARAVAKGLIIRSGKTRE